ncbi:hypothetical protein WG66_005490 [Moniliophthora roreri]|nr:hypothetical protein WG66_005490 [Moniliophthora roreri]
MPPKGKKKKDSDDTGTEKGRCTWLDAEDAILIDELCIQKDLGMQAQNGWKKPVWSNVKRQLEKEFGVQKPEKVEKKIQDHWQNKLKSDYKDVHSLVQTSGFGYESETKCVIASPESNQHNAHYWHKHNYPYWDDMLYINEGIMATGKGAFHPALPDATFPEATEATAGASDTLQCPPTPQPSQSAPEQANEVTTTKDNSQSDSDATSLATTPAPSSQKCQRAPSDISEDAVQDVAAALYAMPLQFNAEATPQRRQKAVKLLEDDGELSDEEFTQACKLFGRDSGVVDMFTAISSKTRRTAYIQSELEEITH